MRIALINPKRDQMVDTITIHGFHCPMNRFPFWRHLWLGALLSGILSVRAADIRVEKIFGPETPTGKYKHPSSITELKNGDLYLAYYGGAGEYAVETSVFGSRLPKGAKGWSHPDAIARSPFY
jgi:hypothetical protein